MYRIPIHNHIDLFQIAESSNPDVFINICKWEMVSKPKDGETRISIKASTLRYVPESKFSVMDVCLHNDVIGSSNKDVQQWKYISYLVLDYIEDKMDVKLSREYKILSIKYKGDIKVLKRFLFGQSFFDTSTPKESDQSSSKSSNSSILDDLSNVMKNVKCTGQNGAPPTSEVLQKNSRNSLIQEIPTKKHKNEDGTKPIPNHFIKVCAASNEIPKCIVVQVELPKVKSGTECDLEVSKVV